MKIDILMTKKDLIEILCKTKSLSEETPFYIQAKMLPSGSYGIVKVKVIKR